MLFRSDVLVSWADGELTRLRYYHAADDALDDVFGVDARQSALMVDRGDCELEIFSPEPGVTDGCSPERMMRSRTAVKAAHKALDDAHMDRRIRRCITTIPNPTWAHKLFAGLSVEQAVQSLWEQLFAIFQVTGDQQSGERWQQFRHRQLEICDVLNRYAFSELRYTTGLGTNVSIGLPEGHIWQCACNRGKDGVTYFSNLPTEEIYTSPHRDKAQGVIVGSMPLHWSGSVIDGIHLELQQGSVVKARATRGEDLLHRLLAVDEGALHLGECALVGWDTPIRRQRNSFGNMLLDENLASHFALGQGFVDSVYPHSPEMQFVNRSSMHLDFMMGTEDLCVVGVTADGQPIDVMRNGVFTL